MAEHTQQNPLGLKPISEYTSIGLAQDYKKRLFHMDWVFCEWYEKLFLVAMLFWSIYAIWRIFF